MENLMKCQYCKNIYQTDSINRHLQYCDKYKISKIQEKNQYQNRSLVKYSSNQLMTNEQVYIHFFQKYDELYAHFLKDKTVALVGPSESISGTNKGHIIDKFDIVVRLNKSLPLPSKLASDIGTKTDILYNSLNTSDYPGQNKFYPELLQKNNCKFLCCPYPFSNSIFKPDILSYLQKYHFTTPFRIMNEKLFYQLQNMLHTRPYTGTCAITDLLNYPIKYLYITGVDFYLTKYYEEYRKIRKNNLKNIQNNTIHKNGPQIEYLKNLSLTDSRIILDNFLDIHLYKYYYEVIQKFKKYKQPIFQFDDNTLEKLFQIGIFQFTYTTMKEIHSINYQNEYNIILTSHTKFEKKENEYVILLSNKQEQVPFLNRESNIKKYIGNFYYHNKNCCASIYIHPSYLQFLKNTLRKINIHNCNVHFVVLLCIIFHAPKNHYFNFQEIRNYWKLNNEELKFLLFLKKKDLIHFYDQT